ncbi:hypothetical protein M514_04620 [Trichuris suis]|uniref:Helix-turn-helix domain-containing protein n=1 Tax=Trichuris suis TaxID=68888 RepID=A0A085NV41_9BILA|nr:hypothetical protein M513_04620 [Trichuris suis]KFD73337.1 hypothetical protein M514_04620 [Trichuris suis]
MTFTMGKVCTCKVSFQETLVIRKRNLLRTNVHRKLTDSSKHLHFSHPHPKSVLIHIVNGVVDRAVSLCDEELSHDENRHIEKKTKSEWGYLRHLIRSAVQKKTDLPLAGTEQISKQPSSASQRQMMSAVQAFSMERSRFIVFPWQQDQNFPLFMA